MKKETRDAVMAVAAALVVMLAVPAVYRIWISRNPPAETNSLTIADIIGQVSADREMRLLETPLSAWTAADRRVEPELFAWLEANASTVLPWEWTGEARRKDPQGYGRARKGVVDALRRQLADLVKDARKSSSRAAGGLADEKELLDHARRELGRISSVEGPYPRTTERFVKSRGRLWGWNVKAADVILEDEKAMASLLGDIRAEIAGRTAKIASLEREAAAESARARRLEAVLGEVENCLRSCVEPVSGSVELAVSEENLKKVERCTALAVKTAARRGRAPEKGGQE